MREKLCNTIDFINKVYNAKINVDCDLTDGTTTIVTLDRTEVLFAGTEGECLAWLAGWQDCARVMGNRHGLVYGGF